MLYARPYGDAHLMRSTTFEIVLTSLAGTFEGVQDFTVNSRCEWGTRIRI